MGTKVNSNYESLLTFTRASGGHALRPVSYGDELVTNGTFDDSSALNDWEEFSGTLSVASQKLRVTQTTGSNPSAGQTVNTTVGKIYVLSLDYFPDDANAQILVKSTNISGSILYNEQNLTSDGTYRNVFVATKSSIYIQLVAQSSTTGHYAEFDNVSLKEVIFDQPDGTLTLFEHPDDVPRVEWDSAGNALGLLVEEARTNKFVYSEAFNETNWQRPNDSYAASTLPFTEQSPTKVANSAATLIDDSSGGTGGVYVRSLANGLATSTPHTFSVFAKKDQLSYLALETKFFTVSTATVYFDLDAGTVGTATNCTGAIQAYPDGWYRCSLTFTTDASDTSGYGNIFVAEGDGDKIVDRDGTSSIFIFGAQFEAGSFPTSYIKNEGTSSGVTRSADVASIPVADFGWNKNSGTVVAEVDTADASNFGILWSANADSLQNRVLAYIDNDLIYMYSRTTTGPVINDPYANAPLDNTPLKHGYAFTDGDFNHTLNGGAVETVASNEMPVGINSFDIGNRLYTSGEHINGHIKSIQYYPRRLSNAQLQDLTS